MEAYMDNSATTRVCESAQKKMIEVMQEEYGNPSSMHTKGVMAERYVKEAKKQIADTLKVQEKEIIFTSGGTESNNLAIIGTVMANRRAGNHIITTAIEHASVSNTVSFLEEQGFRVTRLSVDKDGLISLEELAKAVCEETILVSIMYVNNEIGAVEPIEEAVKVVKQKNPRTYVHVDAIQAYGKYVIRPKKIGIDMLSVSGHKIHGPKGSGFLYVNEKVKMKPIIFGGGQQKNMRSGTENVPGIVGLGQAAFEIYQNHSEKIVKLRALKDAFVQGIAQIEGTQINGRTGEDSAPHIVSVSFAGVRSEVLLHTLEERGIYVSAGSACATNKPSVSNTLKSIGLQKEYLDSTLRFSFGEYNTLEEVNYTLEVLAQVLPMLRRFRRK
ncbi:MAG: cysteine desulfurase family protein [Lachnospiraceae bacterium]